MFLFIFFKKGLILFSGDKGESDILWLDQLSGGRKYMCLLNPFPLLGEPVTEYLLDSFAFECSWIIASRIQGELMWTTSRNGL